MDNKYDSYLNNPILRGKIVDAEYRTPQLKDYDGNPFIEALPEVLPPIEAIKQMRKHPYFNEEERLLPAHLRIHCVERISDLMEPLNKHVEFEQYLSRVIRHGYINRNPLTPEYTRFLNSSSNAIKSKDLDSIRAIGQPRSTACGQVVLGMSGVGKSTVVESALMLYPQVIIHKEYKNRKNYVKQVVWLKLECPYDGGVKGLCQKFFKAMDNLLETNYYIKFGRNRTAENMLPEMSHLATLHGLGFLVIDELQNLNQAKCGGEKKMLNFFVELINTFSIPLTLIGTYKASILFGSAFRDARRGSGQLDPFWHPLGKDREWEVFINVLWEFQWTKTKSPLTPKIIDVLYDESQGIMDIAVKLFKLAQWRAITTGREIIDARTIRSVATDYLKLIRPMLTAIKSGIKDDLTKFEDISIPREIIESAKKHSIVNASSSESAVISSKDVKNKKNPEKIVLISDISKFLFDIGIKAQKSASYATQVVDLYGVNEDISILRREAYILAFQDLEQADSKSEQKAAVADNIIDYDETMQSPDNTLPDLYKQAQDEGKDISQILIEHNLIKNK